MLLTGLPIGDWQVPITILGISKRTDWPNIRSGQRDSCLIPEHDSDCTASTFTGCHLDPPFYPIGYSIWLRWHLQNCVSIVHPKLNREVLLLQSRCSRVSYHGLRKTAKSDPDTQVSTWDSHVCCPIMSRSGLRSRDLACQLIASEDERHRRHRRRQSWILVLR